MFFYTKQAVFESVSMTDKGGGIEEGGTGCKGKREARERNEQMERRKE